MGARGRIPGGGAGQRRRRALATRAPAERDAVGGQVGRVQRAARHHRKLAEPLAEAVEQLRDPLGAALCRR